MRAKKKRSKFKRITYRLLTVFLVVNFLIVMFYEFTIRERIELAIIAEVKTLSHIAVNSAVSDYMNTNANIGDSLIKITTDDSSGIKSITENIYNVNSFKTDVSRKAQKYIEDAMFNDGIDVKLGNFTGLTILSDFGPFVHFNIESTPTVSCEINSTFESTGVNQTMHHIVLDVFVDIYVGNPIRIESVEFTTSYEIAQTIILGEVPSTYGTFSRY